MYYVHSNYILLFKLMQYVGFLFVIIIEMGTIVAAYCVTEPEAWFLGKIIERMWTANSAARGFRGEILQKGTKYLTVSKIQECIGGTHLFRRARRRRGPGNCTSRELYLHGCGSDT